LGFGVWGLGFGISASFSGCGFTSYDSPRNPAPARLGTPRARLGSSLEASPRESKATQSKAAENARGSSPKELLNRSSGTTAPSLV